MNITIRRLETKFEPDFTRVITRFFKPQGENRIRSIIEKILHLSEEEAKSTFRQVLMDFTQRHRNITAVFGKHFDNVRDIIKDEIGINPDEISKQRKLLIGSYFTMEYSIESAAFFNPSIIEDPDQDNLNEGEKRIIVSFRATGEGHISSIVFRGGIITQNNELIFRPVGKHVDIPETVQRHVYIKDQFIERMNKFPLERRKRHSSKDDMDDFEKELSARLHDSKDVIKMVMDNLGDQFTYGELQASISRCIEENSICYIKQKAIKAINWFAHSHYEISFSLDTAISERVIFPVSYTESNGIEDARFVRFIDDDGEITYYATYTAYSKFGILPKFIKTKDFYNFSIAPINGEFAINKGLALFPRKIKGKYAMLSRHDGINNYVMLSDNIQVWRESNIIKEPEFPWEFIQTGNCGSPLETDKGWLVITHGVGPMRRYSLGAMLLDLEDPSRVIGHLRKPLLVPNEDEREGYVPNVIYSCGSIIHNNELIVAYAMSDYASTFSAISLDELLYTLCNN